MPPRPHAFTEDGARRIVSATKRVERMPLSGAVQSRGRYPIADESPSLRWGLAIDDWTALGSMRLRVCTGTPSSPNFTSEVVTCMAGAPDGDKNTFGEIAFIANLDLPRFTPWTCEPTYSCSGPIYTWDDEDEEWDLTDANGCGGTPTPPTFDGVDGEVACGSCA